MKRLFFCTLLFLYSLHSSAQLTCNGYWGPFLVNQTFGQGNATDNWYGPLATYAPGASTSTTFVGTAGPPGGIMSDGLSGLVRNSSAPGTGQGINWVSTTDHTGDANGLMLLVNAPSTAATVFFEYTMDNLCPNTTLRLGVWVLNVNSANVITNACGANTQYPNLTLRVVDPVTNAVLALANTGNVPIDTSWHQFFVTFNNGNNTSVKLQVVNNSVGSGCGNDLALDDITVQACIPVSQVLPKLDTLTCSNTTLDFVANVINSPYSPAEYQWQYSTDGGATWQNQGLPSATPNYSFTTTGLPLGEYLIRYITGSAGTTGNINCTSTSDTSRVVVDSIPLIEMFETICSGQSIPFFGRTLTESGIYDTIIPSSGMRCDSMFRMELVVVPTPQQIMMPDSLIVCQYDSVPLQSNTLPPNNSYTYQWTPSTNLNADTDPNVWFFADASRRYVLRVTNTVNNVPCSLTDTVDVIVNPGDFLEVPQNDFAICPGDSVQLSVSGADTYLWTPARGLSNPVIANPVARPEVTTTYELVGTSVKGCTDTQMINIIVHPAAVLQLPEVVNLYPGEVYYLEPGTNAVFFHWFPNSGINDVAISNPRFNPAVDTRYFVTAKTDFGCAISDSFDIRVKETVLDMPNAFNPNYEEYKVSIRGIATLESFEIYNRWGQKVFETKDIRQGWNGTLKGTPQPTGVYVYQIKATTTEGKAFKQSGNVTLLR